METSSHRYWFRPGILARGAEGLLVQVRRAGRHDHAVQTLLLDIGLDQFLAQAGAHELVVTRDDDAVFGQLFAGPLATSSTSTVSEMLVPQ